MNDRQTPEDRAVDLRLALIIEQYTSLEIIEIAGTLMANELWELNDPTESVIRRLTKFAITEPKA